jgi:fibronectin-binding autotransporter adhesin
MKRKQVIPAGPNRNTDKSLAKWSSSRRIKAIGAAAVAAAGIVSSRSSSALASGPDTWAGVASINFNNSSDWTGTNTPPASGDSLVFTSTYGTGSLLTDDLFTPGSYTIAGITFAGGAPAYTINPNTTGTNGFTLTTGITNSSTNLQTVNDIITLSGADTFALTTGGGNLALGGNISGSGSMSTAGAGSVLLSGSNSYTGTTTIGSGTTIKAGSGHALGTGTVALSGGTLDLGGSSFSTGGLTASVASTITSASAGTVTFTGATNLTNVTVSGPVTVNAQTTSVTLPAALVFSSSAGTLELTGNSGRITWRRPWAAPPAPRFGLTAIQLCRIPPAKRSMPLTSPGPTTGISSQPRPLTARGPEMAPSILTRAFRRRSS